MSPAFVSTSWLLVGVQFLCLGIIAFTGPLLASTPLWLTVEGIGVSLGIWAVWAMRLRHLRALPDVHPDSPMVTRGPYRMVRHPMYTALLLATFALVMDAVSVPRILVWCVLTGNLVAKLLYEERLLTARFPAYEAYRQHTARLVPWIY